MKKAKRTRSLRMADGGMIPVSPFSIRGIGQGLSGAFDGARDAMAGGMEAVHNTFGTPAGYTPAAVAAPVAAPPVEASPVGLPQLGGLNLGAIQRREAAAGLRDGTSFLHGPGGPTDDKIDVKLSRGESVLPADTTAAVGPHNIQNLIDATHTPVRSKGLRHFANGIPGIDVTETPFTTQDARMFGQTPAGAQPAPQPQIPGMDVSERPMLRAEERGFIRDPGPGNPSVGRAAAAPVAEPAPAAAQAGGAGAAAAGEGGGLAYRAGRTLATGLRTALPAVVGAQIATHLGDSKISSNLDPVDSSAAGTMRYLANGDFANVGSSLRKGAVEAGMDLTHGLASAGDLVLPGHPLEDALTRRIGNDLGTNVTQASPTPDAGAGRGFVNPPAATPDSAQPQPATQTSAAPLNNSVLPGAPTPGMLARRGNSFTNTGSFIEDQRGGGQPSASDVAAADRIASRTQAEARTAAGLRGGMDTGTPNLPAGYGATIPGMNAPGSQYERELTAHNAEVHSTTGAPISPRTQVQMDAARMQHEATLRGQDLNASTTQRGQDLTYAGAREGNKVSMRGQDLNYDSSMVGHQLSAAGTRARLQYEMGKDHRDFDQRQTEFGAQQAQRDAEQRVRNGDELQKRVASMTPVGPDGKPDLAGQATASNAVNAFLANQERTLQQRAATGDTGAKAALADLQKNGHGAIDDQTLRSIVLGQRVNDLRAQYGTSRFDPVGGTDVTTDVPAAGLRKTSNGFFGLGGKYTVYGPDGQPQGSIPSRAVEGDGSFFGGKRRTDLRELIR